MLLLKLSPASLAAIGPYRTRGDWHLCVAGEDTLWLRCPDTSLADTATLPALERYRLDTRGQLTPLHGGTIPVATAPPGPWHLLSAFIAVQPAVSAMPGKNPGLATLALTRSETPRPAAALLLPLTDLLPWVENAPRIRLQKLVFAAATDGRALVKGTPLPPLPGAPYYITGALALPCGWDLAPHVWPGWLEKAAGLAPGALALVHENEDSRLELIGAEGFTPLTLAALRLTLPSNDPGPQGAATFLSP